MQKLSDRSKTIEPLGSLGTLFASGVALECLARAITDLPHDAAPLGISPHVLGEALTFSSHLTTHAVYEGWQKVKENFERHSHKDLENAIVRCYQATCGEIEKEVVRDYDCKENPFHRIARFLFNKENPGHLTLLGFREEFLIPLKAHLMNSEVIAEMLSANDQLSPDAYLLKIIEKITPSYVLDTDLRQSFTNGILEKFKKHYSAFFLKEMKCNKHVRTAYFTHLIESSFRKMQDIYKSAEAIDERVTQLVNLANEASISFYSIFNEVKITHEKLDKSYKISQEILEMNHRVAQSQQKISDYFDLIISQNGEKRIITRIRESHHRLQHTVCEEIRVRPSLTLERLEAYLQQKDLWKADMETTFLFTTAININNKTFDQKLILQFPLHLFREIDHLWMKYSNGLFGFTPQHEIWTGITDESEFFNKWECFGIIVGWKVHGHWLKNTASLTYSLHAPKGHLPSLTITKYANTSKWKHAWRDNLKSIITKCDLC